MPPALLVCAITMFVAYAPTARSTGIGEPAVDSPLMLGETDDGIWIFDPDGLGLWRDKVTVRVKKIAKLGQLVPSQAVLTDPNGPRDYLFATHLFEVDCQQMAVADRINIIYSAGGSGLRAKMTVFPQELGHAAVFIRAIGMACVAAPDDHPFRRKEGWRNIGTFGDLEFRAEFQEKLHVNSWPIIEVWSSYTYSRAQTEPVTGSEYRSSVGLHRIDCQRKISLLLENYEYEGSFGTGNVVYSFNSRPFLSEESATGSPPGSLMSSLMDKACAIAKPKPKEKRKEPVPPAVKPPVEVI